MTKLDPKQIKIFAKNSGDQGTTVFGSTANGNTEFSRDPDELQNEYYQMGWKQGEVLGKAPMLEDFNTIQYLTSRELFYLAQTGGFREWIDDTGSGEDPLYNKGSIVNVYDNSGQPVLYVSLVDANQGNNPATDDGSHWVKFLYSRAEMDVIIRALEGKSSRLNGYSFSFVTFSDPVNDPTGYQAEQLEVTNYALTQLQLTDPADIPNMIGVHNLNGDHLFLYDQGGEGLLDDVWIDNGLDTLVPASKTVGGYVQIGDNIDVDENGVISEPVATSSSLGVVQAGSNINVNSGVMSVNTGSDSQLGVLQTSTNINNTAGTISVNTGSTTQKGVLQVGSNLSVSDGTVSVSTANGSTTFGVVKGAAITGGLNIGSDGTAWMDITSKTQFGTVYVGDNINVSDGVISVPRATDTSLGVVQAGEGIKIENGVINSSGGGMPIGSVFYAVRLDVPQNSLRLDGSIYDRAGFEDFYDNYLTPEKMGYISFSNYQSQLDEFGSCGGFAKDTSAQRFRVPSIADNTFIANSINGTKVGYFHWDQIVNMTGNVNWTTGDQGKTHLSDAYPPTGVFYADNDINSLYPIGSGGAVNGYRGFSFNASRQVRTGDRVQPRHITYPLFVVVANRYVESTTSNYNNFISGLNSKLDISMANISDAGAAKLWSYCPARPFNSGNVNLGVVGQLLATLETYGSYPFTIPAGGAWFCSFLAVSPSGEVVTSSGSYFGVWAGGTTFYSTHSSFPNQVPLGYIWRIS
ncbi:hypothetical protein FACS1894152_2230 [Bacilli bacterium]|nr:hypothetical protein FACS1894152_2230 [Bacilli bacterium]